MLRCVFFIAVVAAAPFSSNSAPLDRNAALEMISKIKLSETGIKDLLAKFNPDGHGNGHGQRFVNPETDCERHCMDMSTNGRHDDLSFISIGICMEACNCYKHPERSDCAQSVCGGVCGIIGQALSSFSSDQDDWNQHWMPVCTNHCSCILDGNLVTNQPLSETAEGCGIFISGPSCSNSDFEFIDNAQKTCPMARAVTTCILQGFTEPLDFNTCLASQLGTLGQFPDQWCPETCEVVMNSGNSFFLGYQCREFENYCQCEATADPDSRFRLNRIDNNAARCVRDFALNACPEVASEKSDSKVLTPPTWKESITPSVEEIEAEIAAGLFDVSAIRSRLTTMEKSHDSGDCFGSQIYQRCDYKLRQQFPEAFEQFKTLKGSDTNINIAFLFEYQLCITSLSCRVQATFPVAKHSEEPDDDLHMCDFMACNSLCSELFGSDGLHNEVCTDLCRCHLNPYVTGTGQGERCMFDVCDSKTPRFSLTPNQYPKRGVYGDYTIRRKQCILSGCAFSCTIENNGVQTGKKFSACLAECKCDNFRNGESECLPSE